MTTFCKALFQDVWTDSPEDCDGGKRESERADHHQRVRAVDLLERCREGRPGVMAGLDEAQDSVEVWSELVLADVQPGVVLLRDARPQRLQDDREVVDREERQGGCHSESQGASDPGR